MERAEPNEPKPPSKSNQEPIRFGIDQILGSLDQESRVGNTVDNSRLGSPSRASVAPHVSLPVSLSGVTGALEDSGRVYGVSGTLVPSGVIRVPAHRPLAAAVPPAMVSAAPALCFPWMDNNRRFPKDRLPGKRQTSLKMLEFVHTMQRYLAVGPVQFRFIFQKSFHLQKLWLTLQQAYHNEIAMKNFIQPWLQK